MTPLRRGPRGLRNVWLRLRYRLWLARLRLELARQGGRLRVLSPNPLWLEKRPRIRAIAQGEGDGVLELDFGRDVRIERDVFIEVWAHGTNRLAIGDRTILREGTRYELRSGTIELAADVEIRSLSAITSYGLLSVGEHVIASRGVYVHCEERIEVGDGAALGEWVSLIDSDHIHDGSDVPFREQPLTVDPIEIGENALVARGGAVLRGARIAKNSLVAANSVVLRGSYGAGMLLAGAPAKEVRPLSGER
jgi:acetyltransferase-like isoleucine patch superfamily enzyme